MREFSKSHVHAKRHHHICAAKIVEALLKFVSGFQANFSQLSMACEFGKAGSFSSTQAIPSSRTWVMLTKVCFLRCAQNLIIVWYVMCRQFYRACYVWKQNFQWSQWDKLSEEARPSISEALAKLLGAYDMPSRLPWGWGSLGTQTLLWEAVVLALMNYPVIDAQSG